MAFLIPLKGGEGRGPLASLACKLESNPACLDPKGVWNLVLACRDCNRGTSGKFDLVPALDLVERLHTRNEFLIRSKHPLGETIVRQTGKSPFARAGFLQKAFNQARAARIAT
jgi:hypothetical protein